jgi:hypothetical protein
VSGTTCRVVGNQLERPTEPRFPRFRNQRFKGRVVNTTTRMNGAFLIERAADRNIYAESVQAKKNPNGAGTVFRLVEGERPRVFGSFSRAFHSTRGYNRTK